MTNQINLNAEYEFGAEGLTYRCRWLTEDKVSVLVSGPDDVIAALRAGAISWPTEDVFSALMGAPLYLKDAGETDLEAVYGVAQ